MSKTRAKRRRREAVAVPPAAPAWRRVLGRVLVSLCVGVGAGAIAWTFLSNAAAVGVGLGAALVVFAPSALAALLSDLPGS